MPSFSDEHLRSICRVLGDTNEGLTNSEIDQLLQQAGISYPKSISSANSLFYTVTPKRDRLFQALSKRQMQDRCGNNVASFIQMALNPVKYANSRVRFDSMRDRLNRVLLFSGLLLGEDGKLRLADQVSTISEAEKRANELRARLEERNAHPDVLAFCRAELLQDNYFHAVLE
ncbi:MAG: hypothetical protein ACREAN_07465, partial [Nitrosopumilaceae archaeon]